MLPATRVLRSALMLALASACVARPPAIECDGPTCEPITANEVARTALMALDVDALCTANCDSLMLDPRIRAQSEFNTADFRALAVIDSLTDLTSLARHWRRPVGSGEFRAMQARHVAIAMSIVDSSAAGPSRRIILTIARPDGVVEVLGYRVIRSRGGLLRAELERRGQS